MSENAIFVIMLIITLIYFLPTIVVLTNSNRAHRISTIFVNIFLGWCGIGWVVALFLAIKEKQVEVKVIQQPENKK